MGDLSQRIESAQAQLKQAYITRAAYRDGLQANLDALASQIDASPSMREAVGAEFKRLAPLPQKMHEFLDIQRERPVQLPDTDYEAFTQLFEREGALGKLFHEAGYESKLGNVRRSLRTLAEPHKEVLKARDALHAVCTEAGKPFMPLERAVHTAFKENRRVAPAAGAIAAKPVATPPILKLVEPAPAPVIVAEPAIVPPTPVVEAIAPLEEIAHAAPVSAPKPGFIERARNLLRGEPAEGFPKVEPLHPMTDLDPDKAWPPEKPLGESIVEPTLELHEQAPPALKAVPDASVDAPKVVQGRTEYRATGHERAAREAAGHANDAPYYLSDELARAEHTKILGKVERAERTAAAEAPPGILRGIRQKLSKLWVRVDGLGEPPIVPPTIPTQPPAGLLHAPAGIDFSAPVSVKRAPEKMTGRFMSQKMQAEPRFAPLTAWTSKAATITTTPNIFTQLPDYLAESATGEFEDILSRMEEHAHQFGEECAEHGKAIAHSLERFNAPELEEIAKTSSRSKWIGGVVVGSAVAALGYLGIRSQREQQRRETTPDTQQR